ncbi:hypothetical protein LTS08_008955, partial [Lithohypha guttulata]
MTCDGNFSVTVFDSLEKQKQQLRQQRLKGQQMMRVFRKQMMREQQEFLKRMALEQQKLSEQQRQMIVLEEKIARLDQRQNQMLDHESRLLGELDEAVAGSEQPELEVMGVEDDFFLFDDPIMFEEGFDFGSTSLLSPSANAL